MSIRDTLYNIINVYNIQTLSIHNIDDVNDHPFIKFRHNSPEKIAYKGLSISIDEADLITASDEDVIISDTPVDVTIVNSKKEEIIEAILEIDSAVYYFDITTDTIKFLGKLHSTDINHLYNSTFSN